MFNSRRLRSVSQGFTLMELLAVLVVLAVIGGLAIREALEKRTQAARASLVEDYATDLATMDRAVRAFIGTNGTAFTAGTARVITIAEMQAAGLLPTNFANRSTGANTSPFGQAYRIVGMRDSTDNKIRAVIYENSAASTLRLAAMSYDTTAGAPMVMKREVGASLLERKVIAATIAAGSTSAVSAGSNGWTKAVASYVGTAPAQASVAVLVGFPDLEPSGGGGGPTGGLDLQRCSPKPMTCSGTSNVCSVAAQHVAATCPSGRTISGRWPHCIPPAPATTDTFFPVAQNSAVITLGRSEDRARTFTDSDCGTYAFQRSGTVNPEEPAYKLYLNECLSKTTYWRYTDVILNSGVQYKNWCEYESQFFSGAGTSMRINSTHPIHAQNAPISDDVFCCE